jgi:hypothetical protein
LVAATVEEREAENDEETDEHDGASDRKPPDPLHAATE